MTQIPTKFPLPVGHCLGITLCALSLLLRRLIRRYCQFPRERERERGRTRGARDSLSKWTRSVLKWKEKESETPWHNNVLHMTVGGTHTVWTSLGPGLA